ncbi:MAG: MotA/TolQ/ExbB proton channel family protein [Myxococcota bacterium]
MNTRSCLLVIFAALCLSAPALAQSFDGAQSEIDGRLERALRELRDTRARIAKEKIPLSRTVSQLEQQVLELRRDRDGLLKVRDSRTIDLTSLRKQVDSLSGQEDFIDSRLDEFVRDFESRLDISETALYEPKTSAARLAKKNPELDAGGVRGAQLDVVKAGLERLGAQLGGQVFAGEALSPDGVLTAGNFIALGPTVFYASSDGEVSGLVENQLNAADPVVVPLPGGFAGDIVQVANTGTGLLPLDATLGKALKVEKARKTLFQYIDDGGAVGYVILGLGLAALALTVFKAMEILGFQVAEAEQVDGVLRELSKGNLEAAAWEAERVDGVAGEMLQTGVANAGEKRGVIEELLFEKILRVRPSLERFLPFLAITAAAAPLLGLLGTVIGMIRTFQLITIFGTGDAKSLSSGISEALITTALGLIVAIPTLIMHGALSRMAKRKLGLLEELSVAFVNGATAIRRGPAPAPPDATSPPSGAIARTLSARLADD